jgi:hypothetical protein
MEDSHPHSDLLRLSFYQTQRQLDNHRFSDLRIYSSAMMGVQILGGMMLSMHESRHAWSQRTVVQDSGLGTLDLKCFQHWRRKPRKPRYASAADGAVTARSTQQRYGLPDDLNRLHLSIICGHGRVAVRGVDRCFWPTLVKDVTTLLAYRKSEEPMTFRVHTVDSAPHIVASFMSAHFEAS